MWRALRIRLQPFLTSPANTISRSTAQRGFAIAESAIWPWASARAGRAFASPFFVAHRATGRSYFFSALCAWMTAVIAVFGIFQQFWPSLDKLCQIRVFLRWIGQAGGQDRFCAFRKFFVIRIMLNQVRRFVPCSGSLGPSAADERRPVMMVE